MPQITRTPELCCSMNGDDFMLNVLCLHAPVENAIVVEQNSKLFWCQPAQQTNVKDQHDSAREVTMR